MRTAPPDLPTVALVTGAASGIGACAARALARRGVAVAALDIDETGLRDRLDGLPTVLPLVCDVSDSRAVAAAVQETEDALGPVDKVIHCAGTVRFGPLLEQPAEDLDRLVRVNYLGTAHIARETVSRMAARGYGDLVVIASVASWLPVAEIGAYGASKAAVQQFCQVLALECRGSGVRVVCVCPPAVETPLLDESRRTHPHVFDNQRGIPPAAVLAAADAALARGRTLAFPGRGTAAIWRAHRYAPGLTGLLTAAARRIGTR